MFMLMNSSGRRREVLTEEVTRESPTGMKRKSTRTVSRQSGTVRKPVVEAMQSIGRRFGMGEDTED